MHPVPTILLHGFTGSASAWGAGLLDRLAARVPLVALDLPGHGAAQQHDPLLAAHPPDFLRTVDRLARIPAELGFERADWVGYSMGGRLALALAATHPGCVRRLVLESASPGLRTEPERRERREADERLARALESKGIEWFVDHWMALPLFRTQQALAEPVRRAARERRLDQDPIALAAVLRGLGTGSQPSYHEALPGIDGPVLVMTGALDSKFVAIARHMVRRLPSAVHRSLDGVGHTVHLEAPERWIEEVGDFLRG